MGPLLYFVATFNAMFCVARVLVWLDDRHPRDLISWVFHAFVAALCGFALYVRGGV